MCPSGRLNKRREIKIRHYGILSSTSKSKFKALIDKELGAVVLPERKEEASKYRIYLTCGKGHLVTLGTFEQRDPPRNWKQLFS